MRRQMGTFDVIVWILVIFAIVISLIYYGMKPSKCPKCGKRMKYECRPKNGKEICSEVCPDCGFEIILNEEGWEEPKRK